VFDIQRTMREAYDKARRILHQSEASVDVLHQSETSTAVLHQSAVSLKAVGLLQDTTEHPSAIQHLCCKVMKLQ